MILKLKVILGYIFCQLNNGLKDVIVKIKIYDLAKRDLRQIVIDGRTMKTTTFSRWHWIELSTDGKTIGLRGGCKENKGCRKRQ